MKKISLILIALMLVQLVGCAGGSAQSTNTTTAPTTTAAPAEGETNTENPVVTDPYAHLEVVDYGGAEIDCLVGSVSWIDYEKMTVSTLTGDIVDDEIYKRNLFVSEKLNVTFNEQLDGVAGSIRNQVLSQDKTLDIAAVTPSWANSAAVEGMLANLADIEAFNFDRPYWDSQFNEMISLNKGKIYAAFGDLCLVHVGGTFMLAFNTDMLINYNLKSPYEYYEAGKWTWETMHQLTQAVSTDINGDGNKATLDSDIFGIVGHPNQIRHFIMSADVSLTKMVDGYPKLALDNERYINAFRDAMAYFVVPDYAVFANIPDTYATYSSTIMTEVEAYMQIFNEGRSLFHLNGLAAFKGSRNAEIPYSMICLPKYDESQQDYLSIRYSGTQGIAIPNSFDDEELERNANVIEWLSAYSHEHIMPAFVETTMYYKYARDAASVAMMESVLSRPSYCDIAFIYDWGGITSSHEALSKARRTEIVQLLKSLEKKFNTSAENMINAFADTGT